MNSLVATALSSSRDEIHPAYIQYHIQRTITSRSTHLTHLEIFSYFIFSPSASAKKEWGFVVAVSFSLSLPLSLFLSHSLKHVFHPLGPLLNVTAPKPKSSPRGSCSNSFQHKDPFEWQRGWLENLTSTRSDIESHYLLWRKIRNRRLATNIRILSTKAFLSSWRLVIKTSLNMKCLSYFEA